MRAASFVLTGDMLRELLHLPAYVRIRDVTPVANSPHNWNRDIQIVVESPDLPEIEPGAELPEARPQWTRLEPVNFDGWGLPDYPRRVLFPVIKDTDGSIVK